jgi:hypothetical protein
MTLTRALRLFAIGIVLFASLCGTEAAQAANCTGTGTRAIKLSPCPISETLRYKDPGPVNFTATISGNPLSEIFVSETSTNNNFSRSVSGKLEFNAARLQVFPGTNLAVGMHTGSLDFKFCADRNCATLLAEVQLPYKLDVITVPVVAKLSPASATVGDAPFTLKVLGSFFKPGYKIRLDGTSLATTYVSSTELTAKVNLASVPTGRGYNFQVISLTPGFNSNVEAFTLKNPKPTLTSISPSALFLGAAPFTLQVKGSGFIRTSKIEMDGKSLTTKFVSGKQLTASLDLSAAQVGTHSFKVVTNTPGGGTSAAASLSITNARPVITSLSPNKTGMSLFPASIVIIGSGFQQNSVVQWNGANQPSSYISPTELSVQSPFNSLLTAGIVTLDVTTPSPGGGISNTATFEIDAPAPTISWLSPARVYTGSGDVTVVVKGSNFINTTYLAWNGTRLNATAALMVDSLGDVLQATLPAADLTNATTGTLSVITPGPGGGEADQSFAITQHPPQISWLSPGFAIPGGTDFVLTLSGMDFNPAAQVYWSGNALATTFVSAGELQATVPAADIADAGVAEVTVVNPVASGGVSAPATFAIDASGTSVETLAQPLNDMEWDPTQFVFYGAVPASSATNAHSIATVDPVAAAVTSASDTTDEPILLSLSADDAYLYAAFTSASGGKNSYGRFSLPALSQDWNVALPILANGQPQFVKALQVSPFTAHAYALIVGETGFTTSNSGASFTLEGFGTWSGIGDEPWDTLAWNADGTHLYGGDSESSTASFFNQPFTSGLSLAPNHIFHGAWMGGRMHVDGASGLIYADGSTAVLNPSTGSPATTFPVSGVMAPDSSLGCAYFIAQTQAQIDAAAGDWTLSCYSTTDQSLTRALVIPGVTGTPTKMMRWGNEGLVFITDGGMIYFVSGQVVTGN